MTTNPLQKFMRSEKLFVKLPSNGFYYDEGDIDWSDSREVGVLPMTAMDEILLNTPDALLNGEGIKKAVESCVPAVKDSSKLIIADFETLLLAIRKASYGDDLDFSVICPKCEKTNSYTASVQSHLESIEVLEPPYFLEVSKNLKVFVKPYTFESVTLMALQSIETAKVIQALNLNGDDVSEADLMIKLKDEYTKSIKRIAELAVDTVHDGIDYIEVKEDGETTKVDDKVFIKEWISNLDKKTIDAIQDKISAIPAAIDKNIPVQCEHCENQWNTQVDINPTDFFALGS